MSKEAGYVYYDGDSAEYFLNPFISPSVKRNPSKQAFRQKPLKVRNWELFKKTVPGWF